MNSDEALRKDLDALKLDLGTLQTDLRGLAQNLSAAGRDGVDVAKQRLGDVAREAATRGKDAAKSMQHAIEERPLTSVAIAFGAGLLLGAILRR